MPYVTSVFPAKVALKGLLDAYTWPGDPPTISWGAPTEQEDVGYDMVYLGPTEVPEDDYVTLGGGRTDETYRISVLVDVYRYGDDEKATEARAWELLNALMSILVANNTIAGTVNRTTGFRFRQVNPIPTMQNWRSQILIELAVVGLVFT